MANEARRHPWVDNLRSVLTVMVVAHHAMLAYVSFASFNKQAYILSTHAIVDNTRWSGLDKFVIFNDNFFMALMFLIGGLFLSGSIQKKGGVHFARDRFYRLLLPFIILGTLLMLVAYYPSYYLAKDDLSIGNYIKDFFSIEAWPVGPPWFLWVLFLFNMGFLLVARWIHRKKSLIELGFSTLKTRPIAFFVLLCSFTWLLFVPLALVVGAESWTGFGPFDFQKSRVLLYFGYLLLGGLIGNSNFNREIFSDTSKLIRGYRWWILGSILGTTFLQMMKFDSWLSYYSIFSICCALSSLAFLSFFRTKLNRESKFWTSLSSCAYLIYLLHYPLVTWTQFALLKLNVPALFKAGLTFLVATLLSWQAAIWLRKINLLKKYL